MKAKIYFGHGKWWCRRLGVTGCGNTPREAWYDMWHQYRELITEPFVSYINPRVG